MRISDWSSDVCSSDLPPVTAIEFMLDAEHMHRTALALGNAGLASGQLGHNDLWVDTIGEHVAMVAIAGDELGRASCRERGCKYVSISVVAVSLKKKKEYDTTQVTRE